MFLLGASLCVLPRLRSKEDKVWVANPCLRCMRFCALLWLLSFQMPSKKSLMDIYIYVGRYIYIYAVGLICWPSLGHF